MGVVDDAYKIATTGFDFRKSLDQHRGAYVRRRGEFLHKQNSTWSADRLATQLKAELTVVQNYIAGKDPLINGTETKPAPHFDLKVGSLLLTNVMVKMREVSETFKEHFFNKTLLELRAKRVEAVMQIVWRAVMIHSDVLWKSLGPPPQLQEPALDEILDRRLSTIEQMHITVNSFGHGLGSRDWEVKGPTGPWLDGFRRAFEYPNVRPATNFTGFLPQMGPDWHLSGTEVVFNPKNQVRVRSTPKVAAAWTMDKATKTWINFRQIPGMAPAEIIEEMFILRDDFWNRSWMFCDHVCSLVNIVALGFALFRRTGKPDAFNELLKRPDYISLGPVVTQTHDLDILMADDQDQFFDNTDVSLDDLQLGDFVRFWNSRLYELLPPYFGDWGSEFSLVMGLKVDPKTGKVARSLTDGLQVWLEGHGVVTRLYNSMATEATDVLKSRLSSAHALLVGASDRLVDEGQVYVQWSPYEPLNNAWWAEIPKKLWQAWRYNTQAEVLKGVPRTVAKEAGGTGYNPPPDPEAVYFPLFEPAVDQTDADGDSWRAYLRQRKANASFRLKSADLKPLNIDRQLAPGLFYRGANTKMPVVRPRVRI